MELMICLILIKLILILQSIVLFAIFLVIYARTGKIENLKLRGLTRLDLELPILSEEVLV